ncbi:hypothetical protein U3516DRAFT_644007 [Neocallimastix sp. 'constans']|jgi:hypothetical protein
MPGIDINKKSPPQSINGSTSNNGISISPTKKAIMNAFASSLSRSLSMGSFSYKSLGKSLSQMSYGRSPLFDIYQQFKQSVPKNTLPTCVEEDEMVQDIESKFCKDFTCCGLVLKDLHELLQHFEDAHRMESDMEEEDDLPFELDDLSSNRNNNDNHLTFNDLFFKDLESKQRNMENSNLLNNSIGLQGQPMQQSIAMSDIYSEDKKLNDSLSSLAVAPAMNNTSFSDILNNKINSTNISNLSKLNSLSRENSTSSLSSKLNSSISLNIPNTTTTTTSTSSNTPTSDTTSNFNLSKNISAFNAVSGNSTSTNLFNESGSSSQPQTPNLTNSTLATTVAATSTASTTTANVLAAAAAAGTNGFQALNNLKNIQNMPSSNKKSSDVNIAALPSGMHPIFPNAFNLLNNSALKGSTTTPFNLLNNTMNEEPQEYDDMDMDMDDNNDMMNINESMLMAEAGPDEEKKYRCTIPGCNKSYKNPGGLKYHIQHGHIEDTGDPEINKIMRKPFQCTYENCGKRYKNMNGLKYHIEHSHASILFNQTQGGIGLNNNNQNSNVSLDSQQVLALQALQMQQLQLQHIN